MDPMIIFRLGGHANPLLKMDVPSSVTLLEFDAAGTDRTNGAIGEL
jgi:hypothetical protein